MSLTKTEAQKCARRLRAALGTRWETRVYRSSGASMKPEWRYQARVDSEGFFAFVMRVAPKTYSATVVVIGLQDSYSVRRGRAPRSAFDNAMDEALRKARGVAQSVRKLREL